MEPHDFTLPEGTHTVIMGLGDINGIMRGKRIPASHWPTICADGNAMSMVTFAMDMTCDVWDTPYVNFANGFPDMHVFPATTPVALPWEPGVAITLARAEGLDHKPVPIDPRNALLRQLDRAKSMGLEIQVGAELEFYLLDKETLKPRDKGIGVYGLDRAAELEHVLGPIRRMINDCGIPVEASNPEYAAGQVEVNLRYDEALLAADRVVLFKSLVRQLALAHGYRATFMAKPFWGESGNGFHAHYSIWKDGENVFSDGGALSQMALHFIGGLQKRMAEASVCGAPTPNAYRRRTPMSFCPVNTAWGGDNRTVGLRVIDSSPKATRVEKRDAGADANPYYLMATDIAAGLDGIEQGLEPGPKCEGDAYTFDKADPIPTDLPTALTLARGSDWLAEVIGRDALEIYLQQAERELAFVEEQVTAVETRRYLTNL